MTDKMGLGKTILFYESIALAIVAGLIVPYFCLVRSIEQGRIRNYIHNNIQEISERVGDGLRREMQREQFLPEDLMYLILKNSHLKFPIVLMVNH